jgi:SAM-dependent methyltransferase
MDQHFIGLYFAKKYISPDASYVCCEGDGPLPFPTGFFSVAFCSDAFHYLVNKLATWRELRRLTQNDGLILLVWIHNAHVRCAYDGLPLPVEGYQSLIADMPHCMVADTDVLTRYREKKGPALARSTDVERLIHEPLLSIVASSREEIFQDYGCFGEWPHAEGHMALNPLYSKETLGSCEEVRLRRTFPSPFYAQEHAQCKEYLPEQVSVNSQVLADLAQGFRTPTIQRLIDQFVVLGMPERYQ